MFGDGALTRGRGSRPKPGYPKTLKTFGDHWKVRRLDLGLTQKEVAARLAINADSVRNWETGSTAIEVRYYPALITFLSYNPLPSARTPRDAIRRERMTRGWSRKRLAREAGVDEATIRRLELDKGRIAARVQQQMCEALHLKT